MKKQFFLLAFLSLFLIRTGSAQPCLPEGIDFLSQAQIDSFPENFPGCTVIEGGVTIEGEDIANLDGLLGLASIGGSLLIGQQWFDDYYTNDGLLSLKGLDSLLSIGGDLRILYNSGLVTLNGLEKLSSVGGNMIIGSNPALESLTALKSLAYCGGSISIGNNNALENLKGLGDGNLSSVNGDLFITGGQSFHSLAGLDSIQSIHGHFFLTGHFGLTTLHGLESLSIIDGDLVIYYNGGLTSLNGLENLIHIGERLIIYENASLLTLNGLEGLSSVGSHCAVRYNGSLISLSALEGLSSIGGQLGITDNAVLSSLDGLNNFDYQTIDHLRIISCPALSDCKTPAICDYLLNGGDAEIHGNISGCSSVYGAINACKGVSTEENGGEENPARVFPNPGSGIFHIFDNADPDWALHVYDTMGKVVKTQENFPGGPLDLSALPDGIYFLVLKDEDRLIVERIWKKR